MAASEMGILGIARIQNIFDAVQDQRQIPGGFVWKTRANRVKASDADIIGRFLGIAHIADLVADDQKAVTYEFARIKFEANLIPNVKLGRTLTQEDIKRLELLGRGNVINNDSQQAEDYFANEAENLFLGMDMREESLILGMYLNSFTYARNGIILSINWQTPAELQYVSTFPWTNAAQATPVADILNLRLIAETKYGKIYNRITMSTPAFRLMILTTDFQNQVRNFYLNVNQPMPIIPYQNITVLRTLVSAVLGMEIELYDRRYPTHQPDGSAPTFTPYLPLNMVILSSSLDDRDNTKLDLASGIVTESVVGSMGNGNVLGKFTPREGPFSYVTVTPDLNPPTATFWGVERVFPRKYDLALSATINVGTVTDFITPGIAF